MARPNHRPGKPIMAKEPNTVDCHVPTKKDRTDIIRHQEIQTDTVVHEIDQLKSTARNKPGNNKERNHDHSRPRCLAVLIHHQVEISKKGITIGNHSRPKVLTMLDIQVNCYFSRAIDGTNSQVQADAKEILTQQFQCKSNNQKISRGLKRGTPKCLCKMCECHVSYIQRCMILQSTKIDLVEFLHKSATFRTQEVTSLPHNTQGRSWPVAFSFQSWQYPSGNDTIITTTLQLVTNDCMMLVCFSHLWNPCQHHRDFWTVQQETIGTVWDFSSAAILWYLRACFYTQSHIVGLQKTSAPSLSLDLFVQIMPIGVTLIKRRDIYRLRRWIEQYGTIDKGWDYFYAAILWYVKGRHPHLQIVGLHKTAVPWLSMDHYEPHRHPTIPTFDRYCYFYGYDSMSCNMPHGNRGKPKPGAQLGNKKK